MIGRIIDGKYRVVRPIGQGQTGEVYEAVHTGTGRRVAIKVIVGFRGTNSVEVLARFRREARLGGAVATPYIVDVKDTGQDRETGLPYIVMELLPGENLQQLLERTGPLSVRTSLRILAQICLGLRVAHHAGIVHRDIKPANIFVAQQGDKVIIKLLDFGVSKMNDDPFAACNNALTKTGSLLGSPLYMSPEQANGRKDIDARSDLWSVGVVAYQLLSGRTPFEHIEELGRLLIAICSAKASPLQDLAPWVPAEVAAIVHRALSIEVADRFATSTSLLAAIRTVSGDDIALTAAMLTPISAEERSRRSRRAARPITWLRRGVGLSGVVMALAAIGYVGWMPSSALGVPSILAPSRRTSTPAASAHRKPIGTRMVGPPPEAAPEVEREPVAVVNRTVPVSDAPYRARQLPSGSKRDERVPIAPSEGKATQPRAKHAVPVDARRPPREHAERPRVGFHASPSPTAGGDGMATPTAPAFPAVQEPASIARPDPGTIIERYE